MVIWNSNTNKCKVKTCLYVKLVINVRILYTFNYYFTSVIQSNLEFTHNKYKPQTMWRVLSN